MPNNNTDFTIQASTSRALAIGWQKSKANFLIFFLAVLVIMVLYSPSPGEEILVNGKMIEPSPFFNFVLSAYWLLLLPIINFGADQIFLRGVRGDPVKIKSIVEGFHNYLNIVLAALLVFGLIGIATVVFVVPGIYVACRLGFVSYLVMDEGLDPIEAVEASWRMTHGHVWKIFWLGFLSILIVVFGLALLFIGVFPAVMWAKASFAAMYLSITLSASPASAEQMAAQQ